MSFSLPPLEKVKKKESSDFRRPPPPYEFLDTPLVYSDYLVCSVTAIAHIIRY